MKLLTMTFIFSALLTACNGKPEKNQAANTDSWIESVSIETFKNLTDASEGLLIDVRTPEEYAEGHIDNARLIDVNANDFVEKINLLPKDKPVYVYCRSGKRSLKAATILHDNGFKHIYNLESGLTGWIENGLPIVKK